MKVKKIKKIKKMLVIKFRKIRKKNILKKLLIGIKTQLYKKKIKKYSNNIKNKRNSRVNVVQIN
jgi:hypothetical protein